VVLSVHKRTFVSGSSKLQKEIELSFKSENELIDLRELEDLGGDFASVRNVRGDIASVRKILEEILLALEILEEISANARNLRGDFC
jgi:hypothetical protein